MKWSFEARLRGLGDVACKEVKCTTSSLLRHLPERAGVQDCTRLPPDLVRVRIRTGRHRGLVRRKGKAEYAPASDLGGRGGGIFRSVYFYFFDKSLSAYAE